ncbi:MAG: DegT/DnrJ/EryC1/StrS family aminotransferase [Aestuariivirga sp.]
MTRWPVYDDEQIADVTAVLKSGMVNAWTGPHVLEFEQAYAKSLGCEHAIALANGTLALDLALYAIGLEPGDEVIVTPRSFVASASCVAMAGGVPVFADVDLDSQNITAETIRPAITPRTKAIIPVHLAGWPCDMDPINELAREHGIRVIEDCAQAHGAMYHGRPVGMLGDLAAFSFCQDKIITTGGEGGLLVLADRELWKKAWSRKDHGKSYDTVFSAAHPPGFRWLHEGFGSNWRMTALQAVLGTKQLQRLPLWHAQRTAKAETMLAACKAIPALRTPAPAGGITHAWYRFYTFVRPEMLKPTWDRDRIMRALAVLGVTCFSGSCPEIYREKAFVDAGFGPAQRLPAASALGQTSLAFLVDPSEEDATIETNCAAIAKVMAEASA